MQQRIGCRARRAGARQRPRTRTTGRPWTATAAAAFALVGAAVAQAQLRPDQCALVFNTKSDASRELAEQYAATRGVPAANLLGVATSLHTSTSRKTYDRLAVQVRKFLDRHPRRDAIRCLVTFFDVPLKVAAPKPTPAEQRRRDELLARQQKALGALRKAIEAAGGGNPRRPDLGPTASQPAPSLSELTEDYTRLRGQLAARAGTAPEAQRAGALETLVGLVERVEGRTAVMGMMQAGQKPLPPQAAQQLADWTEQRRSVREVLTVVRVEGPTSPRYDEALALLPEWHGLLGLCQWLERDIARLGYQDCHASVDSELALVLHEDHELYRWLPNPLFTPTGVEPPDGRASRTLMVARLDGPNAGIVRRMIDEAVATERRGLTGTCYVDMRRAERGTAYYEYDRDLLDLYLLLLQKAKLPVVIDRGPNLFAPGTCPDTALYCGWYSPARYVPAFQFVPGAVAWHIASFEAAALKREDKQFWCPGLLRDGATATLGPTAEPYLHTFPRPSRFFGLLLTGKLTLAECFFMSKPYNSWQLTLLGDPLYRPFAKNPPISPDDLP